MTRCRSCRRRCRRSAVPDPNGVVHCPAHNKPLLQPDTARGERLRGRAEPLVVSLEGPAGAVSWLGLAAAVYTGQHGWPEGLTVTIWFIILAAIVLAVAAFPNDLEGEN